KNAGAGGANLHRPPALWTHNVGVGRIVFTHAFFFFGSAQLASEFLVEIIEQLFPVELTGGDLIERLLHVRGKAVIEQIAEALDQTASDDIAHFFRVKALVLDAHITALLNRRDDGGIRGRTPDAALLQLFHQR